MEIVGFWTPEYLQAKIQTLQAFQEHPILLAVACRVQQGIPELPGDAILFKSALRVNDVLQRLASYSQ